MKVGDLVQQGTRVIKFKGENVPEKSKRVGIVVKIEEPPEGPRGHPPRGAWMEVLGRTVDVLWNNGKLTKGFAENSLEVISDEGR